MRMNMRGGFSLVELMVTTSAMTVLGSMGIVALQSATSSANVARAKADAAAEARAVASFLASELQLAPKASPSEGSVSIVEHPYEGCALEVAFTIPGVNRLEARAIRYRFLTEDLDGDGQLDAGEDTIIADGDLTGRVVRLETVRNAEGDPIEVATNVGGAHHVSALQISPDGNLLKIVARASKPVAGTRRIDPESGGVQCDRVEATSVARVYLMN